MGEPIDILKKSFARKGSAENNISDYGKIPPQSKELEDAVIGAVLIEEPAINYAIEIIKSPDVFYNDANRHIWVAIMELFHLGGKIDLLTVTEQLKFNGKLDAAGGPFYIATITNSVGSCANIETHSLLLVEKHMQRQLIALSATLNKNAYEDTNDVFELVDWAANEIEGISVDLNGSGQKSFSDIFYEELDKIRAAALSGDYVTGVQTFSDILDKQLLGLQPQNLIYIAGRPGMGKTSVAWHLALNQVRNGIPVGFFSLEMSDRELIHKAIASELGIDSKAVRRGGLKGHEWGALEDNAERISKFPLFINDKAGLTINQISAISRSWVRKYGVRVIYVDYIAKIRATQKFGNREQEVSHISGRLKDLAKTLNIPVVCLAQLNRSVETRGGDKKAVLSDLRESGSIEQDADIVIFCYRPDYYGITHNEDNEPYCEGYTELDIAKYRHGDPTVVRWIFEAAYSRFKDYQTDNPF